VAQSQSSLQLLHDSPKVQTPSPQRHAQSPGQSRQFSPSAHTPFPHPASPVPGCPVPQPATASIAAQINDSINLWAFIKTSRRHSSLLSKSPSFLLSKK
jgi:hypothetical protein